MCSHHGLSVTRSTITGFCVILTILGTILIAGDNAPVPANSRYSQPWVALGVGVTFYYGLACIACTSLVFLSHMTSRPSLLVVATGLIVPLAGWEILGADVNTRIQSLIGYSLNCIGIGLSFLILTPFDYIVSNAGKIFCDKWNIAGLVAWFVNGIGCICLWVSTEDHQHFPLVIFICKISSFVNSFIFLVGQILKHRTALMINVFFSAWLQQSALAMALYKPAFANVVTAGSVLIWIGHISFLVISLSQLKGTAISQMLLALKSKGNGFRFAGMFLCLVLTIFGIIMAQGVTVPNSTGSILPSIATQWSSARLSWLISNTFFAVFSLSMSLLQSDEMKIALSHVAMGFFFATGPDLVMTMLNFAKWQPAISGATQAQVGFGLALFAMWLAFFFNIHLMIRVKDSLLSVFGAAVHPDKPSPNKRPKQLAALAFLVNLLGVFLTFGFVAANDGFFSWLDRTPAELTVASEWNYNIPTLLGAAIYQLHSGVYFMSLIVVDATRSTLGPSVMFATYLGLDAIARAISISTGEAKVQLAHAGQVLVALAQVGYCVAYVSRFSLPAKHGNYLPEDYLPPNADIAIVPLNSITSDAAGVQTNRQSSGGQQAGQAGQRDSVGSAGSAGSVNSTANSPDNAGTASSTTSTSGSSGNSSGNTSPEGAGLGINSSAGDSGPAGAVVVSTATSTSAEVSAEVKAQPTPT